VGPTQVDRCPEGSASRVGYSTLAHLRNNRNWARTYTGDETWIEYDNPGPGKWVFPGEQAPVVVRRSLTPQKRMLTVFFSTQGIKVAEFLQQGGSVTAEYFQGIIRTLSAAAPGPLFIHMDNAAPHKAKSTDSLLSELNFTRLDHPPYSPDLAPSDFWLFGQLKGKLSGYSFRTEDELQAAVRNELSRVSRQKLRAVFKEWIHRLERCIERGGEYVHMRD